MTRLSDNRHTGARRAPASRRPQARGIATRGRLLSAARELFTRQGFDGTSIEDVARRAGVGVGTVYHHFPDKRAIVLQLIDDWGDRIAAQAPSEVEFSRLFGGDARAAFSAWLRRSYQRLRDRPSLYLVALTLARRDPEVAQRTRRVEALSLERTRLLIVFGQERGLMRRTIDASSAARLVHNAIDVAAAQLLLQGVPTPDPDRFVDELSDMIGRYLLEEPS